MLDIAGITVRYYGAPAVEGFALTAQPGEFVALLGSNGAGKSSILAALSGTHPPSHGEMSIEGTKVNLNSARSAFNAGVRFVPEDRCLFGSLTPREHIRLVAKRPQLKAAIRQTIGWFPALEPLMDRPAQLLSGGEQQMLAITRALLSEPRVLMIDELSLGLAPIVVHPLLDTVSAFCQETQCCAIVVEQHADVILERADRAVVLARGRVMLDLPASAVRKDPRRLIDAYLGSSVQGM